MKETGFEQPLIQFPGVKGQGAAPAIGHLEGKFVKTCRHLTFISPCLSLLKNVLISAPLPPPTAMKTRHQHQGSL